MAASGRVDGGLWVDGSEPEGWWMVPEGGLVHVSERVAVVADVHLGYDWARARLGDVLPPHTLTETMARLESLLERAEVRRLIVAGDLVEATRSCAATASDVEALRRWLDSRGVRLERVAGNHDPPPMCGGPWAVEVGGWTVAHGHREMAARRLIVGHWHPMVRLAGQAVPCFLVERHRVVLPAFSDNAAGVDVIGRGAPVVASPDARCVAIADGELFDFGRLGSLARAVHGGDRSASRR
ncbi:MAG: metallophosphoesterase [Isosphaeraceae bacterium]|jgi:putative SbcD/Mre11-related phosphoesterase|nr:MAG: metallophosphoesterase [Isosphaeraceae bacterium]